VFCESLTPFSFFVILSGSEELSLERSEKSSAPGHVGYLLGEEDPSLRSG
jgi:hypothetical protein